jgi:hypothetical protein
LYTKENVGIEAIGVKRFWMLKEGTDFTRVWEQAIKPNHAQFMMMN